MSQDPFGNWPPPYGIKENPRARRVILRVRPQTGLLITVPRGFDPKGLPEILERHRPWIEERLEEVLTKRIDPAGADLLPATIHFAAAGETWRVTYHEKPAAGLELTWRTGPRACVEMCGDVSRVPQCCRLLRLWVQKQAKRMLEPWVERLSRETALPYQKVTIRAQKTRWGSYSNRGTVSLNAALLFLPPRLVRLVIVHELCHSRHGRHDGAFWHLLASHEPHCRRLDAELRNQARFIPRWYAASFL